MFNRLTASLILAAIPGAAMAQEAAAPAESQPVTRAQISARLDSDYADLDINKDGKADAAEIEARLKRTSEAELEAIKKERDTAFTRFDTDGNGSISRAEFDARAKLPTIPQPNAKPFLDRFDTSKDGAISKDEFRAPTLANFDKMDANKDGTVSPAEGKSSAPAKKVPVKESPPIGR